MEFLSKWPKLNQSQSTTSSTCSKSQATCGGVSRFRPACQLLHPRSQTRDLGHPAVVERGVLEELEMRRRNRWLILVTALLLGLVLVGAGSFYVVFKWFARRTEPPMNALNIYTDTIIHDDFQSAYQIAAPSFRTSVRFQDLVDYHTKLTAKMGKLSFAKQTDWDVDDENPAATATITTNLQFERGTETFQFFLRREDGIWRVVSYKGPNAKVIGGQ